MKRILIVIIAMGMTTVSAQKLSLEKVLEYEEKLDDVMEIIGNDLVKSKLRTVENDYKLDPNELNKVRLGIIYHETALNLTFFYKTEEFAGYAKKGFDILTDLLENTETTPELLIFVKSYRASALSIVSGETKKLKLLSKAFDLFEEAVDEFAYISPRPEFMRGSVAENLPRILWKKRKYARKDFDSIIKKQEENNNYADFRLMSFTYWAWARAYSQKKYRKQALIYLDRAIAIDPDYKAGRKRAEELKVKYSHE